MFPTKEVQESELKDEEDDTWLDEPPEEADPTEILRAESLPHICLASTYLTALLADQKSRSTDVGHRGGKSLQKSKADDDDDDFTMDFSQ
jgi:hypothetical protein